MFDGCSAQAASGESSSIEAAAPNPQGYGCGHHQLRSNTVCDLLEFRLVVGVWHAASYGHTGTNEITMHDACRATATEMQDLHAQSTMPGDAGSCHFSMYALPTSSVLESRLLTCIARKNLCLISSDVAVANRESVDHDQGVSVQAEALNVHLNICFHLRQPRIVEMFAPQTSETRCKHAQQ